MENLHDITGRELLLENMLSFVYYISKFEDVKIPT